MRRVSHALNIPEAPGTGESQTCGDYVEKWVEVSGSFVGDVKIQAKLANAWAEMPTVAAGGNVTLIELLPPFAEVRVDTALVSDGTPVVTLVGRDARVA